MYRYSKIKKIFKWDKLEEIYFFGSMHDNCSRLEKWSDRILTNQCVELGARLQ